MGKAIGRTLAISPFRRLVIDLMHFSQHVPSTVACRRMDLSSLVAARRACPTRPSWAVLFTKAYATVSRDHPVLRRSYLKFPWPRLYEHPHTVASVNIERRLADEDIVMYCLIRGPENRSIAELDALVRAHRERPVEELRSYKRAYRMSRIPWPLRRPIFWASLNGSGRRRCHNFGTFGMTSIVSQGAGLVHVLPVLTTSIHYGQLDERGRLDVFITWDHRVMDGGPVARALADLETVLTRDIVRELTGSRLAAA